jgi:hypothetical protein
MIDKNNIVEKTMADLCQRTISTPLSKSLLRLKLAQTHITLYLIFIK